MMGWIEIARVVAETALAGGALVCAWRLRNPPGMISDPDAFVQRRLEADLPAGYIRPAERQLMMLGHALRHNNAAQIQKFARRLMKMAVDPPDTPEGCALLIEEMRKRRG